jgi:hypothetical protein
MKRQTMATLDASDGSRGVASAKGATSENSAFGAIDILGPAVPAGRVDNLDHCNLLMSSLMMEGNCKD